MKRFHLGGYAYANGQRVSLKIQGNGILVQTEEGLVVVPIEEFDVVMVDGQLALIAEEKLSLATSKSIIIRKNKEKHLICKCWQLVLIL